MKINLSLRKLYIYLLIFLWLANLSGLYLLFGYMDKYVYQTYAIEKEELMSKARTASDDINMDKFENIMKELNEKAMINNHKNISDIF